MVKRRRLEPAKVAGIIHRRLLGWPERRVAECDAVSVARGTVRQHADPATMELLRLLIEQKVISVTALSVPTGEDSR